MANCICSCLRGVAAIVVCILRVLLFIGCVLMMLLTVSSMYALMLEDDIINEEFKLPGTHGGYLEYLAVVGMFIISLVGAHGAYSKNVLHLKIFALVMAISSVMHLIAVSYQATTIDWVSENKKIAERLEHYAKQYQWDAWDESKETPNRATHVWNFFQRKLRCCGLKGPEDWQMWHIAPDSDTYPRTCCSNLPHTSGLSPDDKCHASSVFRQGCMERIELVEALQISGSVAGSLLSLLFALIAIIIAKYSEPCNEPHHQSNISPRPQEYERFQGSVYVRQPAHNENYQSTCKPQVHSGLYPNVYGDVHPNAPPPSYVSNP